MPSHAAVTTSVGGGSSTEADADPHTDRQRETAAVAVPGVA